MAKASDTEDRTVTATAALDERAEERKAHLNQIFRREFDTVEQYHKTLDRTDLSFDDLLKEYKTLGKRYESLLRQATKILRTGDAAQRKLIGVQEELEWRQNLNALWIAQFLAMVATNACNPMLPLYVRNLGITDAAQAQFWSGLVYAGPFFLSIFTVPLWGTLGDKHGRKTVIVRAIIGLTISLFLMSFAPSVEWLLAARILQGAVSGFIAASLGLVASTTPEKSSGYAMGFLQSSVSAGMVLGPLLGGLIADAIGIQKLFFIVSALCFISAIVVIALVSEPNGNDEVEESFTVRDNLRFSAATPAVRSLLLYVLVIQTATMFTMPIMAYFLETLSTPPSILATITGVMVGLVGILTTGFTVLWGRWNNKRPFEQTLLIALPALAIATIAHAFMPHYQYLFPWRVVLGVFSGATIPTLYAALTKVTPIERRGGIMGLASSSVLLGNLLSPVLCSWTAVNLGMNWCFIISGIFFVALLPFIAFSYMRQRQAA